MKRIETNYIDLGKEKLPFRYSILSFIKFQEDFNCEVTNIKTIEESLNYFYCAYCAGCQYENQIQSYDLKGFWNLVEEYPEIIKTLTDKLLEASDAKKK